MMQLSAIKNTVVSVKYRIYNEDGQLLEKKESFDFLFGTKSFFPKVQDAMANYGIGKGIDLRLEAKDAFGEQEVDSIRVEPLRDFETKNLSLGMEFEVESEAENSRLYRVIGIEDDRVILDSNHPFAGLAIRFVGEILAIREANVSEIAAGRSGA